MENPDTDYDQECLNAEGAVADAHAALTAYRMSEGKLDHRTLTALKKTAEAALDARFDAWIRKAALNSTASILH